MSTPTLPPVKFTADRTEEGVRILTVARPSTEVVGETQVPIVSQMIYQDAATAVSEVTTLLLQLVALSQEVAYLNGFTKGAHPRPDQPPQPESKE